MFAVIVHEKGGQPRRHEFNKNEVTIGRVQGNDIILPKQNVSKRHSRIVVKDGKFIIVDLKSTNGTYVNGRKIASPMVIKQSDKIYIGDFILAAEPLDGAVAPAPVASAPPAPAPVPKAPPPPPRPKKRAPPAPPAAAIPAPAPIAPAPVIPAPAPIAPAPAPVAVSVPVAPTPEPPAPSAPPPPARPARPARPAPTVASTPIAVPSGGGSNALFDQLLTELANEKVTIPSGFTPGTATDQVMWKRAQQTARRLAGKISLPKGLSIEDAVKSAVSEVLAVGPLTALLSDAGNQRIMVNGAFEIYVTRDGKTEQSSAAFSSASAAITAATRLLNSAGTSTQGGFGEGILADGTRVHVAMPEVGGPHITLDRPASQAVTLDDLVSHKILSAHMATFLRQAVEVGRNIVIASNDVDARLELIGALIGAGAGGQRVVAVEAGGRLAVAGAHLVTLSASAGSDSTALVHAALKMRPDRLVVADARGSETFHALTAMAGAVNGGILGIDAESADDAWIRLVRQSSLAIRSNDDQLEGLAKEAADVLVQLLRYADGHSCITSILDVDGEVTEIFSGLGEFKGLGHVPRWVSNAQSLGHSVDTNIFN